MNITTKKIILTENAGVPRFGEYVRIGVPFSKGELFGIHAPSILSPAREEQPVQVAPLSYWSDGSIKWMLLDFAATVSAWERAVYHFVPNNKKNICTDLGVRVTSGADAWCVDAGTCVFLIDAREFRPFIRVNKAEGEILATGDKCVFLLANGNRPTPKVVSILVKAEGPLRATLAVEGRYLVEGREICHFFANLDFFAGRSYVHLDFTIRNPRRAQHSGGFWDLGDVESILFEELALDFGLPPSSVTEIQCSPAPQTTPIQSCRPKASLSLYQESSGGKNWLSPAHRNRDGKVPFVLKGYRIRIDDEEVATGERATPILWCGSARSGVSAVLPYFWQEFPKAIHGSQENLKISLFPASFPDLHELQGGEQKSHTLYLDFASQPSDLEWVRSPLAAAIAAADIVRSKALFDLPASVNGQLGGDDLIDRFISGPDEFLRKREAADEYGWRNFGDIYADHESVYHEDAETFVSHYNNQYDICAGMYRKYMMTGDPLWRELASDLARHISDIDIYHTDRDREEYNHGLFWHTDHYATAGLSTHRSFSREQIGDRDARFCGGGPGAEHCYTTGLMLHYFLTGDLEFRDTVINLAEWSYRSVSGSQPVIAAVKRAARHMTLLMKTDKSSRQPFPRYPLSRSTGNALNASLDAYEVSGDERFVERAEELIRGSVHPNDDLIARNLLDAENSWYYTVLLSSIIKYLFVQEERGDLNEGYSYAKTSFLAYAKWMAIHEYPYLDKPEILEYPNETWPAQDLRKSVIFYHAAKYSEASDRGLYFDRARFFYNNAREELIRHSTTGFTRPLALILQNSWVGSMLQREMSSASHPVSSTFILGKPTPFLCTSSVLARIVDEVTRSMCESSPRRELAWISARMKGRKV